MNFFTKEEVVKGDFLFVSYKREDRDVVFPCIELLLEEGIRLWYDKDLSAGQIWTEVAEELIRHENCRGAIFFNSVESFKSDPVFLERGHALSRMEKKSSASPFFVIPVNIGQPSTLLILQETFRTLPNNARDIEREFPLKYISSICNLFRSETIYVFADPQNPEEARTQLYENVVRTFPTVVDKDTLRMKQLNKSASEAAVSVSLGVRKSKPAEGLPSYLLSKNQRSEFRGSVYLIRDGRGYRTEPLSWRPVFFKDDEVYLLCEQTVDQRGGGKALNEWLKTEFLATAFSPQEGAEIREVRLFGEPDVAHVLSPDLLSFPTVETGEGHWWLDTMNTGALQKVMDKDGSVYHNGYNNRTKKSGVRPLIRIGKDFFATLTL